MSSTFFGKTEKQSSKFKGIDINTIYKGSSSSPPKTAPTSRQHGLQVLGKVQSIRRMPPPANLPSLKSQSGGNDPNINIVPTGTSSAGWSLTREERKTASPLTTSSTTTTSAAPRLSQQQQAGGPLPHPYQMETHIHTSNASHGEGGVLWSDVTSGGKRNYLDRKSFSLQEDFPELSAGGEEKNSGPCKKEVANRDQQYGLGPSLRPQNVASWRDGGGKGIAQHPPQSPQSHSPSPQRPSPEDGHCAGPPYHQVSSEGIRPGMIPSMIRMAPMSFIGGAMPPMTSGAPYPQRPPYMMMMPPYNRFRPGFPPPYPPNFIPQGVPHAAFMGPDYGMRPRMPQPSHLSSSPTSMLSSGSAPDGKDKSPQMRTSVVKERDLEQFDKLDISEDNGWARSSVNVDYSEKLVFSDEEEGVDARDKSKIHPDDGSPHAYKWTPMERGWSEEEKGRRGKQDESTHSSSSTSFKVDRQYSERSIGEQRPNSVGMLPGDVSDMYHHPTYNGPHGRHPQLYDMQRHWHGPAMGYDRRMFPQAPHYGQSLEAVGSDRDASEDGEHRTQHKSEITSAVERARQRREEEERRLLEHQKNASMLKLKQLDEKINAKKALSEKQERVSVGNEDDNDREERETAKTGNLNKPTSMTSLASDGSRFMKSLSQQSVDRQSSSDPSERPDSNPCPASKQPPANASQFNPVNTYPGMSHRMHAPHPTYGYWGGSFDPRWGAVPFPHGGYGLEQTRYRMKGQLEHSGSLDDLHQGGSVLPKHPLPAPPQPHNYYQYHPHNYIHGDPYDSLNYMGEYKDAHRGSTTKEGEKPGSRQKTNSGSDGGYYKNDDDTSSNTDNRNYSGPKKTILQQPSDPPQRKIILHRKKSESEKSDERIVTTGDVRERMCSTSSGVSSKAEEIAYHEAETRDTEDGRVPRNSYHDSCQDSHRGGRRFEDDNTGNDDNSYKPSHNIRADQWSQLTKKPNHKIDRRTDLKRNLLQKDNQMIVIDDDDDVVGECETGESRMSHHKEPPQTRQQHGKTEDAKKEGRESIDTGELDDDHYRPKKNDFNRNADSPNTYERKPKPKERPIYQHHQWQRSACPPPISMDQAEQNQPNSSCYISLKKQQSNNYDNNPSDRKQDNDDNQKCNERAKPLGADKKSVSKESLKSDKKEIHEGTEERKRNEVKVPKKSGGYGASDVDYKENKRQKRPDRDGYYDRERYSYWRNDERDGKEYYSRKDHGVGKANRPGKGDRSDGHKERSTYRGNIVDDYHPKDGTNTSKEVQDKDFYGTRDKDDGYQATKVNKKCLNTKSSGKSQDVRSDMNAEDSNVERTSKRDTELNHAVGPGRHNEREEVSKSHGGDKNGESRKDVTSQDESRINKQGGGRPRGGRGGKGREYSDIRDLHGEDRHRPQGSREFVRGGSKNFGGRGGRDQQRMGGYAAEEEDDEWEDERVVGGRGGGRFMGRSGMGRRNTGRKPKVPVKDGLEDKPQKKNPEGKKSFKDNQASEDPKKQNEGSGGQRNGPVLSEGIPSLMSKTISPPAMAKMAASFQLLADREEKLDSHHGKQGKDGKMHRNLTADNDQDKTKEEGKHVGPHYDSVRLTPSTASITHRQPLYHRYHHQYHPVNNYDRRPRSSRGPGSVGHSMNSIEKNSKITSGTNMTASNSASTNIAGLPGKDKRQASDVHNEEWETASEGSEVITGTLNPRTESTRQHQVKESNGEIVSTSTNKKNLSGTRADKNQRRFVGHNKTTSNRPSPGDDTAPQPTVAPESDIQHNAVNDKNLPSLDFKGQTGKNKSINNGNKMVEGSSGDGSASSYGNEECGEGGVVDNFPSTGGDGGGKDTQVYYLHDVQYDNQDALDNLFARARRKCLMRIIDPWPALSSSSSSLPPPQ